MEHRTLAGSLCDEDHTFRHVGADAESACRDPAATLNIQPAESPATGKTHPRACQADFLQIAGPQLTEVSSGLTWRDQLRQAFITSYYSDPVICANLQFMNTFHGLAPQSAAMDSSRDALCLIHLGIHSRDKRLLHEGRKIHCAALRFIREEIEKPDAIASDSILGACYTVAHCEVSKPFDFR